MCESKDIFLHIKLFTEIFSSHIKPNAILIFFATFVRFCTKKKDIIMNYDPIKRKLGTIFNRTPQLRILFYKMLDVLLLRTWHVKGMVKKMLDTHANEPLQIMDAGMGFGQYSYWLSSRYSHCTLLGVDVKEEQVADCNNFFQQLGRTNCSFATADLTQITYQNQFDFILNVDVMEHILEDELVLRNFYQALKPNGSLLISTPSDQGGSDVHDDHEDSFIGEHVRDGYSIADMTEKLQRAGFKQINIKYAYGKYGHISWILSMKLPIQMLNCSKWLAPVVGLYYIIVGLPCLCLNKMDVVSANKTGSGLIVNATK